jgi:hypothetical protein
VPNQTKNMSAAQFNNYLQMQQHLEQAQNPQLLAEDLASLMHKRSESVTNQRPPDHIVHQQLQPQHNSVIPQKMLN